MFKDQSTTFDNNSPDHTEGMRVVEEITSDWSNRLLFKLKIMASSVKAL